MFMNLLLSTYSTEDFWVLVLESVVINAKTSYVLMDDVSCYFQCTNFVNISM